MDVLNAIPTIHPGICLIKIKAPIGEDRYTEGCSFIKRKENSDFSFVRSEHLIANRVSDLVMLAIKL